MSDVCFDESIILLDMEADTAEEVLTVMGNNLVDKGLVKDSFIEAIITREAEFATGLPTSGVSVAIPHTDVDHVNKKTISIAVLKNTVDFGVMGEAEAKTPVKLVFMLAMDQTHSQLTLLQRLMQVFQDKGTLQFIANEKSKTKIKNLLADKLGIALKGGD